MSSDSWAGDYQILAAPVGTFLFINYFGMQHATEYHQNANNILGKTKGLPAIVPSNVTLYTDITRVAYIAGKIFDRPLVLEAAFSAAAVSEANIGGPASSKSGIGDTVLWFDYGLVVEPKNERFVGFTNFIYLPTGVYDKRAGINPFTPDQYTDVPQIGWTEGLSKFGLNHLWFDFLGNMSIHSDGGAPVSAGPGIQFNKLSQDTSYDVKAFLRYVFAESAWVAAGVEKSWGGNQIASGGVLGAHLGPTSLGTDDFLKLHFQASAPITSDFHVAVDFVHGLEANGGLKEDFGAEFRIVKFFMPRAPLD